MTSLGSKGRKLTLHCDGLMCGKKRIKIVASKSEDTNSTSSRRFPDQRARLAKGHCSDAERRWINWRLVFRLKWSMERGQVNLRSENELTLREMWEVGCTRLGQHSEGTPGGVVDATMSQTGICGPRCRPPHLHRTSRVTQQRKAQPSGSMVAALTVFYLKWWEGVSGTCYLSALFLLNHLPGTARMQWWSCRWLGCPCVVSRCGWAGRSTHTVQNVLQYHFSTFIQETLRKATALPERMRNTAASA